MDLLGKGSIMGFNGILMSQDSPYMATVKSKKANILRIPK